MKDLIGRASVKVKQLVRAERETAPATHHDLLALIPNFAALIKRVGVEHWWIDKEVYAAFEQVGLHLTQNCFYSPLPDLGETGLHYAKAQPLFAATLLLDSARSLDEWRSLAPFFRELNDIPRTATAGFYWDNWFFPNLDAFVYYGLVRRLRPKRVVEIGSGFSTHIAARALRTNGSGELHVIEPYPASHLLEVVGDLASFHRQRVQDMPFEFFASLAAGDLLFIDSSHVSKVGSDVNHILFEIIPRLTAGLALHFHDIFLPHEYPKDWILARNWAWNEQYLLLAFLMGNANYRPLIANQVLLNGHEETLRRDLCGLDVGPLSGGSLWIQHSAELSREAGQ